MSCSITPTTNFAKELKQLMKKYPRIKEDIEEYCKLISEEPCSNIALKCSCYKFRMAISDKNSGKSGGARIITHYDVANNETYLLSIYDKSDKGSLFSGELEKLLKAELNYPNIK